MYILRLAYLQLRSKPVSSLMNLLLFAIGMAMVSFLIIARHSFDKQVSENLAGIDLVVGAKGSPLQLILSAVMHIDYPTGNISLSEAETIARHPFIREAIPVALGDNYRGFRIVGTTHDLAGAYAASMRAGHMFSRPMEATIGARVASQTGLGMHDTFSGVHGFQQAGHRHDEFIYTVTGILEATSTVIDNLILTPVESVWMVHDHDHGNNNSTHDHHDHDDNHGNHGHRDHDDHHDHVDHRDHDGHRDHDDHHDHDGNHDNHGNHGNHDHHDHDGNHDHHDHDDHDDCKDDHDHSELENIRRRVEAGEDISQEEMALFLDNDHAAGLANRSRGDMDSKEITAMLLFYRSPAAAVQLPRLINETTNMQAASPAIELNRLLSLLGYGFDTLNLLAWVIILISVIQLFVQLVNSLKEGMLQMALMRVMGCSKTKVFALIMYQGLMLSASGWLTGILLSRVIWASLPATNVLPGSSLALLHPAEILLLAYASLAGMLAAAIPAWRAYKTDIHFTIRGKQA